MLGLFEGEKHSPKRTCTIEYLVFGLTALPDGSPPKLLEVWLEVEGDPPTRVDFSTLVGGSGDIIRLVPDRQWRDVVLRAGTTITLHGIRPKSIATLFVDVDETALEEPI